MTAEAIAPGRARILIVEDEGVVAWDMARSLGESFEVTAVAGTAEEAIQRATEIVPDLVLMDIRIRGDLDGIETADVLRRRFGVPVLYLTAHGDTETVERARKTDPYGYLLKPFKRPDLLSAVRIALFRHQMEQELRSREHFLATTLRSIGDAVIMTDAEGKVTLLNPPAEQLTGWSTQEAFGQRVEEVFHLRDDRSGRQMEMPIARALRDRAPVHIDAATLVGKGGAECPIIDSAAPIVDERMVYGAVMVLRDVTESRKLQRQLEFADRLASLGTMAAGVAHEINNPLAFIVANIEHAVRELEDHCAALDRGADGRKHLESLREVIVGLNEAREGTDRVARIVSDLRSFGRDDRTLDGVVDIRSVLEWAINVTGHAWRHRARIVRDFREVPNVRGDESRLGQIFVNLLVNASQAIDPGHPSKNEIRITTRCDNSETVSVEVHDTGAGMPEEVSRRIFEPFFTTKPIGTGTGLGLSICHGIISALGGTIEVDSRLGIGSTFTVSLPAAPAGAEPGPTRGSGTHAVRPQTTHVLVVDDDHFVRLAIQRTLQARHQVTCVASVREAIAAIERTSYDAILCDLMMPDESGIDFFRILQETQPALLHRVAFLTGGAFSPTTMEFLQAVPNPKLEKPFDSAELHELVDVLARKRAQATS